MSRRGGLGLERGRPLTEGSPVTEDSVSASASGAPCTAVDDGSKSDPKSLLLQAPVQRPSVPFPMLFPGAPHGMSAIPESSPPISAGPKSSWPLIKAPYAPRIHTRPGQMRSSPNAEQSLAAVAASQPPAPPLAILPEVVAMST